jgi:serine/threonine-protein kinase
MQSVATLTSLEWHQLNKLLAEALELDPPKRATWIEQQTDLKPELASALRALLEKAARDDDDELASPFPAQHQPGELIGPYRLVREVAQGGMGVVWVAERADGSFERQVALKLPRPEWAAPGLAERMARERAILASLNHPHIAQLYDAGWTADGRPFLALEFVEGVPIDSYIAAHSLGVRERLRLFVDVVRAVAFAHTRLIVHRDLKPANVLVTADGNVKLLDFGISKLTRGDQTGAETALTRASGRAMTLAYAAPEQILGQSVSAATDVYALGVMLYELLTGSRPYRPKHDSKLALEEAVLHADPIPPSKAVASQNARELRGDLDTVVLKALKKAPIERYATAAEFADDLEAFLAHHPVKARPDSAFYRTQMFVRRNRRTLGVTAALAATVLVGAALALWQAQATKAEAQRADAIKEFVLAMIRQADPMLAARQRDADDALLAAAEQRVTTDLESRPETAMELRLAIAEAHRNRGLYDRAKVVLQEAMREGRRTLPDDHRLMTRARIIMAYGVIMAEPGVSTELDRAIATARRMGPEGYELLVEGLVRRHRLERIDDRKRALQEITEAYELAHRHLGPSHLRTLEASAYLAAMSSPPEALAIMAKTYQAAREKQDFPPAHPVRLMTQAGYGMQLVQAGQKDEGLQLAREAVDTARTYHGDYGKVTEESMAFLAVALGAAGDAKGALDARREVYRITTVREPPTSPNRRKQAMGFVMTALSAGQIDGVGPAVEEVLSGELATETERVRPTFEFVRSYIRGLYQLHSGRTVEAEEALRAAALGFEARKVAGYGGRLWWGYAILENGRPREALDILVAKTPLPTKSYPVATLAALCFLAMNDPRSALRTFEETDSQNPPAARAATKTEMYYHAYGRTLLELGRPKEALVPLAQNYAHWAPFGPSNRDTAHAGYWYGRALVATGDVQRGRELMREAIPVLKASPMPSHLAIAARASI